MSETTQSRPPDSQLCGSPSRTHSRIHQASNSLHPNLIFSDFYERWQEVGIGRIDMVLTDPPFGILEKEGWDRGVALDELESAIDHVLKLTGLWVMFCNLELLRRTFDELSTFKMRSYHAWHKTSAMPISRLMPLPDLEYILVLKRRGVRTKDLAWHPKDMLPPGKPYEKKSNILESPTRRHIKNSLSINPDGKRWVSTVIEAPNKPNMPKEERSGHPSQKPEGLLRLLIRGYSNRGDTILDPFAGSGSTLLSAYKEGRKSIGFEIEESYYQEAMRRIDRATAQEELW